MAIPMCVHLEDFTALTEAAPSPASPHSTLLLPQAWPAEGSRLLREAAKPGRDHSQQGQQAQGYSLSARSHPYVHRDSEGWAAT